MREPIITLEDVEALERWFNKIFEEEKKPAPKDLLSHFSGASEEHKEPLKPTQWAEKYNWSDL